MNGKQGRNRIFRWLAAVLVLCMALNVPLTENVFAANKTKTTKTAKSSKKSGKWVKNSKGYWSYTKSNGKKATSLYTIKEKTYYFDSKGRQLSGWQKIKNSYYFFRQGKGPTAYMMTNTTVNGIKLGKDGKAVLDTDRSKRKAAVMCNAQTLVQEILADSKTKTKSEKLRILFDWTQQNTNIVKTNIGGFHKTDSDWDLYYAERLFGTTARPARGDCYTYASIFGYMANALGYTVTICSSGHHGFVRIGDQFYDPSWQKAVSSQSLYAMSWGSIAPGLGTVYAKAMKYTVTI